MNSIQTDIVTGKRKPGEKLPGGRDLAIDFSINPNTAARVYQELEKTGLCETKRGLGTFVTANSEVIESTRYRLADEAIRQMLRRLSSLGISREKVIAMIQEEEM